jgi:hypothetical protein
MEEYIKALFKINQRDFTIWNYLWIFSKDGKIKISITQLEKDFKIPKSSLNKTLNKRILLWNKKKKVVGIKRLEKDIFQISFIKEPVDENEKIYNELYIWIKSFYLKVNYDYIELSSHKRYIKLICKKLEKVILNKKIDLNDKVIKETFILYIENIDGWWLENKLISLPTINKSFSKILNQMKPKNAGESKYSKAAKQSIDQIDFTKFAQKN